MWHNSAIIKSTSLAILFSLILSDHFGRVDCHCRRVRRVLSNSAVLSLFSVFDAAAFIFTAVDCGLLGSRMIFRGKIPGPPLCGFLLPKNVGKVVVPEGATVEHTG